MIFYKVWKCIRISANVEKEKPQSAMGQIWPAGRPTHGSPGPAFLAAQAGLHAMAWHGGPAIGELSVMRS
jgi:hypothetical protein